MNFIRGDATCSNQDKNNSQSSKHIRNKKLKLSEISASFNHKYLKTDLMQKISECFLKKTSFCCDESGAQIHSEPFSCCVLPNFFEEQEFLEDLQDELLKLEFQEKSNDLYKFHQSCALQNYSTPSISALKNVLYKEFTKWLTTVTKITFSDNVDMTCARYEYTDILLCHDDELEGRRIAFIFYLVPPWNQEDGGSLDLFDVDDNGQPRIVTRSLFPKFNNLIFFEVSPVSFHQVAEVLSKNKCRLSVSGWFHADTLPRPPPFVEPRKIRKPHEEIEEETFYDWINPLYLDLENQTEIMDRFQDDSEIQLQEFFTKDKFKSVCEALTAKDIQWRKTGPANKRKYEVADEDDLPSIVQECISVMRSEMMFLLLSNFTALKLHTLAPDQESSEDEQPGPSCHQGGSDDEVSDDEKIVTKKIVSEEQGPSSNKTKTLKNETISNYQDGSDDDKPSDKKIERKMLLEEQGQSSKANFSKIPSCHGNVRRWQHGDYTLLHDTDTEGSAMALDAVVYFNCRDWKNDCGGYTSYVAKGEDEELLSVTPEENCLSLVYRDEDTLRFVKHINHRVTGDNQLADGMTGFHDISFVYYE